MYVYMSKLQYPILDTGKIKWIRVDKIRVLN